MTRQEVITKIEEMKESLKEAKELTQEYYEELLAELSKYLWALLSINDSYPWEQLIVLQDKHNRMNMMLPNVTDEEFEDYIIVGDLIAVTLEYEKEPIKYWE